jgi:hypothetical protein
MLFAACRNAGRAILPAAAFQAALSRRCASCRTSKRRLKAGGSQDWLPHRLELGRSGLRLRRERKWFQNGSVNITVKGIPESVYRVMKREAKEKRRSLNAEIIQALETEAAEAERRRQLSALRRELDRFAASLPPLGESVPLIRGDRER